CQSRMGETQSWLRSHQNTRAPESFATAAAAKPKAEPEDIQREIIDFDSEGAEGAALFAFSTATGLTRFTEIPWPKSLVPKPDATARNGASGALPKADAL